MIESIQLLKADSACGPIGRRSRSRRGRRSPSRTSGRPPAAAPDRSRRRARRRCRPGQSGTPVDGRRGAESVVGGVQRIVKIREQNAIVLIGIKPIDHVLASAFAGVENRRPCDSSTCLAKSHGRHQAPTSLEPVYAAGRARSPGWPSLVLPTRYRIPWKDRRSNSNALSTGKPGRTRRQS